MKRLTLTLDVEDDVAGFIAMHVGDSGKFNLELPGAKLPFLGFEDSPLKIEGIEIPYLTMLTQDAFGHYRPMN